MRHNFFQIYYNEKSKTSLIKNFTPIDNTLNPRPDWYEIYPILKFFECNKCVATDYYGFFSPKLTEKTQFDYENVKNFLGSNEGYDIYNFSHSPCQQAFFVNSFEQGEWHHPNLLKMTGIFLKMMDGDNSFDILNKFQESSHIIFSNFFLARGSVWSNLLIYLRRIYSLAEEKNDFAGALNANAGYGNASLKVFIAERLINYLIARNQYAIKQYPISKSYDSLFGKYKISPYHIHLDALKKAYIETGNPLYKNEFLRFRQELIQQLNIKK